MSHEHSKVAIFREASQKYCVTVCECDDFLWLLFFSKKKSIKYKNILRDAELNSALLIIR